MIVLNSSKCKETIANMQKAYVIANFGGPRSLQEVESFLRALLTDKDVIRTRLPSVLHRFLFGKVAKKRARLVVHDYEKIGGSSPIWADTEYIAETLQSQLKAPILTFHRYLTQTHQKFLHDFKSLEGHAVRIFPLFPQFTYATTGSIARFFTKHFSFATLQNLQWVKSYPTHPSFIRVQQEIIRNFLKMEGLHETETVLIFSAHGLPKKFIEEGDPYECECRASFYAIMEAFPGGKGVLCYQSKFGKGEWLHPYTLDVCENIEYFREGRSYCVFVPISFTSDHIETLFEVEEQYMPILRKKGLHAFRVPALNRNTNWINTIVQILNDSSLCTTQELIY